jgi:putative ABC transport system permease protein
LTVSRLLRWISLRHLWEEPGRTLLTLTGVALGVGVFLAIRLANTSALASFTRTVDAVSGRANLQVAGGSGGFDERHFPRVRRVPGVQAAAPVVQVAAPAPGLGGETLMVLGLDPFSESEFGRVPAGAVRSAPAGFSTNWLAFLAGPPPIAVTRSLARRYGLEVGSSLEVTAGARRVPFRIAAILESEQLDQAFGGNLAVIDLRVAQHVFARGGRLDRIDLMVLEGEREAVSRRLEAVLPADLRVVRPESRGQAVANMLAAFQLNLTALSFIALFVSLFLVFNAISMAVIQRRRETGILRSLGVRRSEVLRLFLAEAVIIGAAGTLVGVGLGIGLAHGALGAVSKTVSQLYVLVEARSVHLSLPVLAQAAGIGFAASVVAAAAPALEASRTPAGMTLRQGALIDVRPLALRLWFVAGVLLLGLAGTAAALGLWLRQPLWGFVSAMGILTGFAALTPAGTVLLNGALERPLRRLFGAEGRLAVRYLTASLARTTVIVASLMVAMAMLIGLSVMVSSFRDTVDTWVNQTIKADLYVEPAGRRVTGSAAALPPGVIEAASAIPGVAAVDTYRGVSFTFRGREAWLAAVHLDVLAERGRLLFRRGSSAEILRQARAGEGAVVTESFSRRFEVREGDTLLLPTPGGHRRLRVYGIFYDYATEQGTVLIDRSLYRGWFHDPTVNSMALYLAPGADAGRVRAELLRRTDPQYALVVTPNSGLRRHVLDVFDQTFRITYALQGIAVLVAVLGILNTLTALILQRGREIGILRAIGALRGQVRRIVVIEAGLIGLTGYVIGALCGLVLAALLVFVINRQFFGWSIRLILEPTIFVQAFLLVLVTSLLAGLWPARHAAGRAPAEAMRLD